MPTNPYAVETDSPPRTHRRRDIQLHFLAAGHPAIARINSFDPVGDGAAADYDTADALGFLVEAVEPPGEMPAVDFTL